jgi:hypothetical protein
MARSLQDRRSGKDRRRSSGARPPADRRRQADRRQFPPPENPASLSAEGRELLQTIDDYKKQRGLARISVDELLSVMTGMGYRRT